jgi:lipopolysaccharide/colanic/teichoic acid biosynthesis glycosyltransferase
MDVVKRVIDLILSILGIAVLWPLLLVCGLAVKISSPGPVLYLGKRTGQFGKPFKIFKFRSMQIDAESVGGSTTGERDPRITRIGAYLRKYKLDELPQLFNVLIGDMSFVGPRPEVEEYTNQYSSEEQKILDVRPGITDLSSLKFNDLQQIVGDENPDEVFQRDVLPQKNALRLQYAKEHNIFMDLKILVMTVAVIVRKPFQGKS